MGKDKEALHGLKLNLDTSISYLNDNQLLSNFFAILSKAVKNENFITAINSDYDLLISLYEHVGEAITTIAKYSDSSNAVVIVGSVDDINVDILKNLQNSLTNNTKLMDAIYNKIIQIAGSNTANLNEEKISQIKQYIEVLPKSYIEKLQESFFKSNDISQIKEFIKQKLSDIEAKQPQDIEAFKKTLDKNMENLNAKKIFSNLVLDIFNKLEDKDFIEALNDNPEIMLKLHENILKFNQLRRLNIDEVHIEGETQFDIGDISKKFKAFDENLHKNTKFIDHIYSELFKKNLDKPEALTIKEMSDIDLYIQYLPKEKIKELKENLAIKLKKAAKELKGLDETIEKFQGNIAAGDDKMKPENQQKIEIRYKNLSILSSKVLRLSSRIFYPKVMLEAADIGRKLENKFRFNSLTQEEISNITFDKPSFSNVTSSLKRQMGKKFTGKKKTNIARG